jgi:hypothetical protein
MTRETITHQEIITLLSMLTALDQRNVGDGDVLLWHAAGNNERWTYKQAERAIVDLAGRWTPEQAWRIVPGHVTELIRKDRRQPERFDRLTLTGPPSADEETRKQKLAEIALILGRSKAIPEETRVDREAERVETSARIRRAWAAVDACGLCDEGGMRLDVPGIVCEHPPAAAVGVAS